MNDTPSEIKLLIYDKCAFEVSDFKIEKESKEYVACQFKLEGMNVITRNSKTTPKKVGQFVTFWKRINNGSIQPFSEATTLTFMA